MRNEFSEDQNGVLQRFLKLFRIVEHIICHFQIIFDKFFINNCFYLECFDFLQHIINPTALNLKLLLIEFNILGIKSNFLEDSLYKFGLLVRMFVFILKFFDNIKEQELKLFNLRLIVSILLNFGNYGDITLGDTFILYLLTNYCQILLRNVNLQVVLSFRYLSKRSKPFLLDNCYKLQIVIQILKTKVACHPFYQIT